MSYKSTPSSLSLLKDYPRCHKNRRFLGCSEIYDFWLHYNKNIRRPAGIFPSLPNGMDKILKTHFDKFMEKGELPPELQELNGDVKLFDDAELLKIWRSNFKGIQWTDKEGNLFRGAVIFNTDIVKMKISIKNAEAIFKKALNTLKGDMPESSDDCDYCKWVENCEVYK